MKSILTILSVACVFTLGACATKTASSSSCCTVGKEQKCGDGSCDTTHKGHSHAKPAKKK